MLRFVVGAAVLGVACVSAGVVSAQAPPRDESAEEIDSRIEELLERRRRMEESRDRESRASTIGRQTIAGTEESVIVRVYDLADLFVVAPDYPAQSPNTLGAQGWYGGKGEMRGGGLGGGGLGGGFFSIGADTLRGPEGGLTENLHQQSIDITPLAGMNQLIATIQGVMSPEKWKTKFQIHALGTSLIVTADDATHRQIEALLTQIREKWRTLRTMRVRAWFVWLAEQELEELVPEEGLPLEDGKLAQSLAIPDLFKEKIANEEQVLARMQINCFNGQTVASEARVDRLAITGYVTEENYDEETGKTVFHSVTPDPQVVSNGVVLEVTPMSTRAGKIVTLNARSLVTRLIPEEAPEVAARSDELPPLDPSRQVITSLATTVRVPASQVTLVGGLTSLDPNFSPDKQLYLFVRVDIQDLRDDLEAPSEVMTEEASPADAIDSPADEPSEEPAEESMDNERELETTVDENDGEDLPE